MTLLLFLTVLFRICVILVPSQDLFSDLPGRGTGEELLRGNTAKDFIDGLLLPIRDYQIIRFWGGSFVIGLVAVPFFLLFGPTLIALRLSTLVFGMLGTVCIFLILDRFVSKRAAWIGGLLFCFPPPGYTFLSCIAYGTHVETNALALLMLFLFLVNHQQGSTSRVQNGLLGFVTGFTIYFGYTALLLLALLASFEFLCDKLFFLRKTFWIRVSGFVLGFLPWIYYNTGHQLPAVRIYRKGLFDHFTDAPIGEKFGKLAALLRSELAESFLFRDAMIVDGRMIGQCVAFLFMGLLLFAAWHSKASISELFKAIKKKRINPGSIHPVVLFLAYVPLFYLAYALSDFEVGPGNTAREPWVFDYRYLLIPYPILVLMTASALDALWNKTRLRRMLALVLAAMLIGSFFAGTLLQCDRKNIEANLLAPGYSLKGMGRSLLRFCSDLPALDGVLTRLEQRLPEAEQHEVYSSLSEQVWYSVTSRAFPESNWERKRRDEFARMLIHLHERTSGEFARYFNVPAPLVRSYKEGKEDIFWRNWRDYLERGQEKNGR